MQANKTTAEISGIKRLAADILLVVTAFFWGITFVVVKEAISHTGVFVFLAQRFTLAALIMTAIALFLRRPFDVGLLAQGAIMGVFLFGGYAFQTAALVHTTASNAAFLTGMNVALIPFIGALFFGHHVNRYTITGIFLAAVGLYLLSTNGGTLTPNSGDALAGICAISVALHVIYTGKYAANGDAYWLTAIQLGTVALLSIAFSVIQGNSAFAWHREIAGALAITVIFATVFAFLVQTSMQRFTSPSRTALIFCMEPVFAGLYAWFAAGERLSVPGFIGAALIFTGMALSESDVSSS